MSSTKLNKIVVLHLDGARKGDLEVFAQSSVSIGRSGDCDLIFVNEKSTSNHHAMLRQREESIELLDTQSTSGTFVNEVRVERALLKEGDVVRFGVLGPTVKISVSIGRELTIETPVPLVASGIAHAQNANERQNLAVENDLDSSANTPLRNWRVIRTALVLYAGGSAAAIGVFNTVIELYKLDVRWFSVFLVVMAGGLISTLVEAWYRGTPGTQKFQWWEVMVHGAVAAACLAATLLILR